MGGSVGKIAKKTVGIALSPMTAVNGLLVNKASGLLGGGGSDAASGASSYEDALARIALEQYNASAPMRQSFIQQGQSVLDGSFDAKTSPTYAPLYDTSRSGIESQYGVAKDKLMGSVARGGSLTDALSDLEVARASDVGSLPATLSSSIMNNILSNAYSSAFGSMGNTMSSLSSAANMQNQRTLTAQAAQEAQDRSLMGGIGTIGGYALGSALGGPAGGKAGGMAGKSLLGK